MEAAGTPDTSIFVFVIWIVIGFLCVMVVSIRENIIPMNLGDTFNFILSIVLWPAFIFFYVYDLHKDRKDDE